MTFDLSKQQIINLFTNRSVEWLQTSVEIANCFPHVWEAIQRHLAKTQDMHGLKLRNLLFMERVEYVEYSVVDTPTTVEAKITFPIDLMLSTSSADDEDLIHYLETESIEYVLNVSGTTEEIASRRQLEESLRQAQNRVPGLYINIPRMVEVEELSRKHKIIQGPITETVH